MEEVDKPQSNKLTINKVAELCGVSKTTVSRYLNGKFSTMSTDTRERIASVIEGLDYRPNRTAQRLKAQKAMLIGCVIANVGSPFSAIMLQGIANVCEQAGYQVLFADSREDPERERRAIQGFIENQVDGLLVNTTGGNEDLLCEIQKTVPVVLVDRPLEKGDFDEVTSPNFEMAQKSSKLLLGMGYEHLGFITENPREVVPRIQRRDGYIAAMTESGLEPEVIEVSADNTIGNASAVQAFIKRHPGKRLALLSVNGVTALYAMTALNALNITVGYDFGFCTFDDWEWMQLSKPSISTLQMGTEEKGAAAAKLLIGRIDNSDSLGEETQHVVVPAHIILRDSTCSTAAL